MATTLSLFSFYGLRIHRHIDFCFDYFDYTENENCSEDIIREHVDCCHLTYIALSQPAVFGGRLHNKKRTPIVGVCMIITHQ